MRRAKVKKENPPVRLLGTMFLLVLGLVVVYVVLALAIGAVTRQDLQTLPKGEKLADRLHLR